IRGKTDQIATALVCLFAEGHLLLEAMQERAVTIDGVTHPLGDAFTVIATQNPIEQEGTYRLPEAQLDRFLLRTALGYPDHDAEVDAVKRVTRGADPEDLEAVISLEDTQKMIAIARGAHVDDTIHDYVVRIVTATRSLDQLRLGSSTRGALALIRASRALAVAQGRPFVTVDDVKVLAPAALSHRLLLTPDSELRGVRTSDLVEDILDRVEPPAPIRREPARS
ncbi:MAG: MoxR family ATPase, partial [Ilumatobacteraceae bacterium]